MINALTVSQKLEIIKIRDEWLQISQTQKDITIQDVEEGVKQLYALDKRKKPIIIILDDPLQCQYLVNIISNKKGSQIDNQIRDQIDNQIRDQIDNQIDDQIRSQIDNQIGSQIRNQIDNQIDSQIGSQIGNQIDNQIRDQIDNQIDDQIRSQIRNQIGNQIRDQIDNQIDSQIGSQIGNQIDNQIGSQIGNQIDNQIDDQIGDQIDSQIGDQIRNQIGSQIRDQIDDQIGSQIGNQIDNQIRNQIGNQIDNQIGSQIGNQIDNQIGDQIGDQIRNQIGSQIGSQIDSQIGDQIRDQIDDQKLEIFPQLGGLSWRCWYYSYFEYYLKTGLLKVDDKLKQKTNHQIEFLKKGVWDLIVFENICIISKCPKTKRDENQRLHSVTSQAVEFKSGYGFYAIHGVVFEEKLWNKVSKRKLSAKEVLSIENIEQRFAAIRHYGMENIFEELDYTLIDKSQRGNELYSIAGINPDKPVLYLKYNDKAPTGRVFVKGISDIDDNGNPIITADAAQAWSLSLTLKEYNNLKVES